MKFESTIKLPNFAIKWVTGRSNLNSHFFDPYSKQIRDTKEELFGNEDAFILHKNSCPRYLWIGYSDIITYNNEECLLLGIFCVHNACFEGNKGITLMSEMLINKDKQIWYRDQEAFERANKYNRESYEIFKDGQFICSDKLKNYRMNIRAYLGNVSVWLGAPFETVAEKFFNSSVGYLAGNKTFSWGDTGSFLKWTNYTPPKKKKGKMQNKVDDLVSISLPEHTANENDKNIAFVDGFTYAGSKAVVIRTFSLGKEAGRIYVLKDGVYVAKNNGTEYVYYAQWKKSSKHWRFTLQEQSEEVFKGTKLEYYRSILDKLPQEQAGLAMWLFLAYPITEKIAKTGDKGFESIKVFIHYLLTTHSNTNPMYKIEEFWGELDESKKRLHQIFGVHSRQMEHFFDVWVEHLERASTTWWFNNASPASFKKLLDQKDLSSIDNETFKKLICFGAEAQYYEKYFAETPCFGAFVEIKNIWDLKTAIANIDFLLNCSKKMNVRCSFNPYVRTFRDFCCMVEDLSLQNEIKPKFSTIEEMTAAHDMITEVLNAHKGEVEDARWERLLPKWEKWKYEDENFIVIVPAKPEELATEGIQLHHCVKSYIPRVLQELTNILFIRQKENPNIPFFTVEVSNKGFIEQIHGLCNCNMDTEPGLTAFVEEWSKKCNLILHNPDKTQ